MVVAALGTLLPLIDGPTTAFRLDPILSRHVLCEKSMLFRVIVDVGAHVGSFTRACLDRGAGRVISCEPEFHEHLRANLAAYGDRVTIVPKAIGGPDSRSCIHPFSDGRCRCSDPTMEPTGSDSYPTA
jgi:hypothetical protein